MNLTKYNSKDVIDRFISDIVNARREESLVCVVGAGVSIAQGYPDWNHYVQELINYWGSNLRNIVRDSKTLANKVERTDVLFLENLSNSAQSNKRKVDLVNFIVRKYCNTGDSKTSETMYQDCYLECEKFIFSEAEPLFHENATLNELVKLNAAFLTTNYDEEIENAYRSILGGNPQVIPDAFSIKGSLTSKMVIHLHGLPSVDSSKVISSSKSYTELYLKPNDVHERIKNFFLGKQKPVIIYVGCSMEEDEVLTLLECNGVDDIQHYALMKYDDSSQMPQENEARNSIIQDYYNQEQSVQFIWYGNRFSDLTEFSAKLAESVHNLEVSFLPNPDELEEVLLSNSSQTNFLNTLNNALRTKSYYVVDSIFKKYADLPKELEIKNIEYTFESLLFNEHMVASPMFIEYWKCMDRVFLALSQDLQEKIISEIKQIKEWNIETTRILFEVVLQYVAHDSKTRVKKLDEILGHFLNTDYFDDKVTDQDIRCLWLSHQVDHSQNIFMTTIQSDKAFFDFNQDTLSYFEESLNNLQNKTKYMSMSSLLEDTIVKSLTQLIQSEKLTYEQKRIFPASFYKNILIQRILMYLDLQNDLDPEILECLRKSLDINNIYLGSNLVKFSQKNNIVINDLPRVIDDNLGVSMMSPVREQAFFNVQPVGSIQQVNVLIKRLKETPAEKSVSVGTSFVDIGVEGQRNQIESVLNSKNQWENHKAENFDFLKKLINDTNLLKKYISVVVKMLEFAFKNGYDTGNVPDIFLQQLRKTGLPVFTISNEGLFSMMIQQAQDDREAAIYRFLFHEVDPVVLASPDKSKGTDFIDLSNFINTESGIYYSLIKKIENNFESIISGTNKSQLLEGIKKQDVKYRCYLKGMFAMIFEEDSEVISCSGFVGFSHNYRLNLNKKWPSKFKKVVAELLNSQIDDNWVLGNMAVTMLISLRPEDYQRLGCSRDINDIKSAVLRQLMDFFIKKDNADKYNTSEWLQWFIQNYSGSVNIAVSELLRKTTDISTKRGNQLLNIIDRGNILPDEEINTYAFSYIPHFDELDHKHLILIGNCLRIVFAKNLLPINEATLRQVVTILKRLSDEELKDTVFAVLDEATHVLPPDDINKLKDDFKYRENDNHDF